ncbi:glutamate--tRNA ligase [Odoribacter sp. Z80]|uniref:glutamate--tRNA ligase n=1 Tax=Odoribacter sp. Z80 TaxID=2304575 RepID=UPI001379A170|nr:glutamate--tRNA ligase [Odoribacter sp. Z80]NCE72234.1 glutamate--tRNA ligase [Odoribacter sp. Z80]
MERKVRVRFAPSPTGALHLGGVRTALFNYLFARHYGGDFLLRIEDTDQTRYVPGAEEYIIESLKWCGLKVDEGVGAGGEYGPYRQSERKAIYKAYAEQLIASGNAYYSFDTAEELDALRKACEEQGETFIYNARSRKKLKNSLNLSPEEVEKLLNNGTSYVIRFKMPENEELCLHDVIRGEVHFNSSLLDDKVLYKSDGMPTYHLANIVDDHLMKITHVIRGEEWLPSLPLHVLLYKAFGWEDTMPVFAHLPLILKPVGNGKLSKRDGNKMGFPVFPMEFTDPATGEKWHGYKEDGYFPEAFINMLALLGWNPGTEQEIFSMQELCELFTLDRVKKSGAKFDPEKTKWFNHKYLVAKSDAELATLVGETLTAEQLEFNRSKVERICGLMKERYNFVKDLYEDCRFFFVAPTEYNEKDCKKYWKDDAPVLMKELLELLKSINDYSFQNTEKVISAWITEKQLGFGKVMNPFRVAIVGAAKGPHMFDVIEIIGKEETIRRMEKAIATL